MQANTHPDIAALVDPLFSFAGKRVKKSTIICPIIFIQFCKRPLSATGEERVTKRSDGRVSQLSDYNWIALSLCHNIINDHIGMDPGVFNKP
jgi:hypothetical protein